MFKVGDRVKIHGDSKYQHNQGNHGTGTITNTQVFGNLAYIVTFDDNYRNSYGDEDLTKVSFKSWKEKYNWEERWMK